MAFTTANSRIMSSGNLKVFAGDWTGSVGDATGTVTLQGGRVYGASFSIQDGSSQEDTPVPYSTSISGDTITISVFNKSNVTSGRFIIWYA